MQIQLVIVQGGPRGRQIALPGTEAVLGRLKGCTVRIAAHEVSRKHCRIREQNGQVTILDLGSANGTFINGRRIAEETLLAPGDQLQIGSVVFAVETPGAAVPALPRADVVESEAIDDVPFVIESADAARPAEEGFEIVDAEDEAPAAAAPAVPAKPARPAPGVKPVVAAKPAVASRPVNNPRDLPMAEILGPAAEESGLRSSRRKR